MTFLAAGGNCKNGTNLSHASCQTLTEREYFTPSSDSEDSFNAASAVDSVKSRVVV